MASFVYYSTLTDLSSADIDFGVDSFKIMLVETAYVADQAVHSRRDDVTNEVSGTGYTAGGAAITCTPSTVSGDRVLTFAATSWATATFTAGGAVVYKSRGGASSADELIFYLDFGGAVSSSGGTFAVSASPITIATNV